MEKDQKQWSKQPQHRASLLKERENKRNRFYFILNFVAFYVGEDFCSVFCTARFVMCFQ